MTWRAISARQGERGERNNICQGRDEQYLPGKRSNICQERDASACIRIAELPGAISGREGERGERGEEQYLPRV